MKKLFALGLVFVLALSLFAGCATKDGSDLKYIQERSFWVDWKIIFKTIGAVIRKEGE